MKKNIIAILFILLIAYAGNVESIQISDLVEAARNQIGKTLRYDPSYQAIAYPSGDVPIDRGVCTDVIIRAFRSAYNFDLQKYIHEDMENHFSEYPQIWGLSHPDKNIDHRRVPNLQAYFKRKGWELPLPDQLSEFETGDLVTCTVPPNLPHIMIVSDRRNRDNIPLVIHNIGSGAKEDDILSEYPLTGHYRIKDFEPFASVDRQDVTLVGN